MSVEVVRVGGGWCVERWHAVCPHGDGSIWPGSILADAQKTLFEQAKVAFSMESTTL
jgi:hypothetical protein